MLARRVPGWPSCGDRHWRRSISDRRFESRDRVSDGALSEPMPGRATGTDRHLDLPSPWILYGAPLAKQAPRTRDRTRPARPLHREWRLDQRSARDTKCS